MALIATDFTVEIVLLIIGLYISTDGLMSKFGAIGIFSFDLQLIYSSQVYVSDLTSTPLNVFLFLTPPLQQALVSMLAILILITLGRSFITIARIVKYRKEHKLTLTQILEEFT